MNGFDGEQEKGRNVHPILHGNHLPMWIYDRETLKFLDVSEGAILRYGYTRDEFLRMTIDEIGPAVEWSKLEYLDPVAVNGSHRWTHRRKDGTKFSVGMSSNVLIYKGSLARLVVVREDPAQPPVAQTPQPAPQTAPQPTPQTAPSAPDAASQEEALAGIRRIARDVAHEVVHDVVHEVVRSAVHKVVHEVARDAVQDAVQEAAHDAVHDAYSSVSERPAPRTEAAPPAPQSWPAALPDLLFLEQRAEEALDHADRTGRQAAVVCLDIDHLEDVVERFGPSGVDDCLDQIQQALTRRIRGMDTVARTGTNTFTVVLAELDDDFDLYRVAEALLKIFAEPMYVQGHAFAISASIGIAVYPDDGFDLVRLIRAADTAMHQAQASGGHRIAMFSLEVRERTELDAYMRETLQRGGFTLYYQPQYSQDGQIRTLEALLRLPGKETGFISPDLFIPIAEDTGMIEQLGMWVIEQASRQVKAWHREYGRVAHVAVNVSPLQLRGHNFAEKALSMIRSHGVVPASIEFEITERAVLNFDEVSEPMRKLSEAGIVFAVDDFGTGYSSLQHLHRLPISVLKIDRSFVQQMGVPQGAEAIIEAIISMAHSLGMMVVAEGVETLAQESAATGMGCDAIQGFLHTAAVEPAKIPSLMGWTN